LVEIILPALIEVVNEECLPQCDLLSSVIFESWSGISRIEDWAFIETALVEIAILAWVETLGIGSFGL
jgi:hypothetical protein